MHLSSRFAWAAFSAVVVIACGGGVSTTGHSVPASSSSGGATASSSGGATASSSGGTSEGSSSGSPAACTVLASDYDNSCTTDADCTLVPPGGNICDPCSVLHGAFQFACVYATVSSSVSAQYLAAIQPGIDALKNTPPSASDACLSSCPVITSAVCKAGQCAQASPFTGVVDAGQGAIDDDGGDAN